MLIVLIRTIILFIVMFFTMKLIGKKYIAQLEPYELVVSIMIAELATLPLEDKSIPLIYGIICILTILFIEFILSQFQLKSLKIRKVLGGGSIVLIENGKFIPKNLAEENLTINDVIEELRTNGQYDISKIGYAILESNGKIGVIPKENNIMPHLPTSIILDGEIDNNSLQYLKKDISWLNSKLESQNINSYKDIFYAYMDTNGNFNYQIKKENSN